MTYYLIAGERSGDLHGANLIRAIHTHDPQASFRAYGGDQMEAAWGYAGVPLPHYGFHGFSGGRKKPENDPA